MIKTVDKVEILTLQDNYIDVTAMDNNQVIQRAMPLEGLEIKKSILAEHGFSALVSVSSGSDSRHMLFDFGFSADGAARNATALGVDMAKVEAFALSHGHSDHTGALDAMAGMTGKKDLEFVVHPAAFMSPRYLKYSEELKVYFPAFSRDDAGKAGLKLVETSAPYRMLGDQVLFLGEIPRINSFEKGLPVAHRLEDGVETWDPIEDDTALVINVKDKGLVILSGCAHSGIINTVHYAKKVTGIDKVYAVMGGFHLSGPLFEPIIDQTTQALKEIDPVYVIPTHCTGRKAIMHIEKEMPEQFILNMSGTRLTFA